MHHEENQLKKLQDRVTELERQLEEAKTTIFALTSPEAVDITERKRAEEALQTSESKYRSLVETAFEGVWVVDTNGRTTFVNRRMAEMLKYDSPDDLMDRSAFDFVPPEDLEILQAKFRERLEKNNPEQYDVRLRCRDGSILWASVAANSLLDQKGNTIGRLALFMNITERKQVEEALRKSEEKFSRAFQSNPAGMTITRVADNRYTDVNMSFCEIVGYTREQILGRTSLELGFFTRAEREEVMRKFQMHGNVHNQEFNIVTKHRMTRRVLFSLDPIEIAGEPSILATMMDITERKRAEDALAEGERRQREITRLLEADQTRLAAVLRHLPVGVWIAEQNGRMIASNEEADRIWGGEAPLLNSIDEYDRYVAWYPQNENFLQPEEYPLAVALRTGELAGPMELNIRRFDGSEGTVLASATPIKNHQGMVTGAVGVNVDITERKEVEEKLLSARDEAAWLARLPGENPNPVARASAEGIVLYHNPPAANLPGWTCAVNEPLPALLLTLVQQAIAQETNLEQDVLLGERFYSVFVAPILNEGYANVYGRDVTEHKRAEQALIESQENLRQLNLVLEQRNTEVEMERMHWQSVVEGIADEVWVCSTDGKMSLINLGSVTAMGLKEFKDKSLEAVLEEVEIFYPDREVRPPQQAPLLRSLTGEIVRGEEIMRDRRTGKARYRQFSSAPTRDTHGQITGAVAVVRDITDLKEAEKALAESRHRINDILGSLGDGLFALNREWSIIYINPQAALIAGRSVEGLVGKNLWELWPELIGTPIEVAYRQAMENGVPGHFQVQGNQSSRWYDVSVYPSSEGITVFYVDKTDQILTEQARQESEERFAKAFRSSPDAMAITRLSDALILDVNDGWVKLFGYERNEVLGQRIPDLGVYVQPEARTEAINRLQQTGLLRDFELEVRLKSGEIRQVSMSAEQIEILAVDCLLVVFHDITERKQVEQALRESEQRFHSLADSMPQLIWTALPDGTVDYYNQRYLEYQEIEHTEGTAWEWAPVLHPDDLQPTVDAWNHSVETGDVYEIEHQVRRVDGSYRWHLSRAVSIRDEKGRTLRWFGTSTDIHDLKLAQEKLKEYAEQLERSNRELEQFAFYASHDLQEPLRKIQMFGDLLLERGECLEERERDYLERMRAAAGRMRDMVEGLLQLSRITTQAKKFTPLNLSQVVADVLSDLEGQIRRVNGKVSVEGLPTIEGDPMQIRQLMLNLIGNALKYHRPDTPPEVKIYAKPGAGKIQVFVEDNGIGFNQEDAEQIFEPFRRLVGRSQYDGNGIGLSICRRIAERHGGNVTAVSQPGQGATFIVNLPVHPLKGPTNE